MAKGADLRRCNGCAEEYARMLGIIGHAKALNANTPKAPL